jgi:hypothetical protein
MRQKYSLAIKAKGKPFPTEPLIMALLLAQHKMIGWLARQTKINQKRAAGRITTYLVAAVELSPAAYLRPAELMP